MKEMEYYTWLITTIRIKTLNPNIHDAREKAFKLGYLNYNEIIVPPSTTINGREYYVTLKGLWFIFLERKNEKLHY